MVFYCTIPKYEGLVDIENNLLLFSCIYVVNFFLFRLALRLSLKSKSEGQGEDRRITIGKKIAKWDLVKELLRANCENEAYKLIIPSNFENMWTD